MCVKERAATASRHFVGARVKSPSPSASSARSASLPFANALATDHRLRSAIGRWAATMLSTHRGVGGATKQRRRLKRTPATCRMSEVHRTGIGTDSGEATQDSHSRSLRIRTSVRICGSDVETTMRRPIHPIRVAFWPTQSACCRVTCRAKTTPTTNTTWSSCCRRFLPGDQYRKCPGFIR